MNKLLLFLFLLAVGLFFFSIPISDRAAENLQTPESICISMCRNSNVELSNGPCLSDFLKGMPSDWVCDVAHSPRLAVDNLPENQCRDFRSGKAHKFVEVDENCNLIRVYG